MAMVDREKVLSVLIKRFPGAPLCDVAAAANAIVGLEPEFEAVPAVEIHRFDCGYRTRDLSLRHVANGDVVVFCRAVRASHRPT